MNTALEADRVVSCVGHVLVTSLCATHEEADTRIILHAIMQCHMVTTKLYSMLYINSMIVQVGNVVGGNVHYHVLLILPFMFSKDNETLHSSYAKS